MKYLYGNSWEKYSIEDGETWMDVGSGSAVTVCDILGGVPKRMFEADMVYCDPPWSLGNANSFYTKAEKARDHLNDFSRFYLALFRIVERIMPQACYLEIGRQNKQVFELQLAGLFPIVQEWEITYYRKHPCFLLRGGHSIQDHDFTGMDDEKTPEAAIRAENPVCVADLCTGRGLTAVAAHRLGKRFVGTELNRRRLAVAIDRVNKLGGRYAPLRGPESGAP